MPILSFFVVVLFPLLPAQRAVSLAHMSAKRAGQSTFSRSSTLTFFVNRDSIAWHATPSSSTSSSTRRRGRAIKTRMAVAQAAWVAWVVDGSIFCPASAGRARRVLIGRFRIHQSNAFVIYVSDEFVCCTLSCSDSFPPCGSTQGEMPTGSALPAGIPLQARSFRAAAYSGPLTATRATQAVARLVEDESTGAEEDILTSGKKLVLTADGSKQARGSARSRPQCVHPLISVATRSLTLWSLTTSMAPVPVTLMFSRYRALHTFFSHSLLTGMA